MKKLRIADGIHMLTMNVGDILFGGCGRSQTGDSQLLHSSGR